MTGGTRKKGTTWYYYFDLGKVNGKRKKKEKGGFKTKKEAQLALTAAIHEFHCSGQVFEPANITVSDYLDEWYELFCKLNLKYSTQISYLRIIEGHLKPKFGIYKLKALKPSTLQEYANSLKLNGYSRSHICSILTIFQSALNYAIEPLHYINQNPMKLVKFPKVEKKTRERIILTLEDWQKILNRFKDSRYYIPLMIGFYTGLRISETFALTWNDIDFEKKTLTVNKQMVKRNFGADARKAVEHQTEKKPQSSWYFTSPKTISSNRTIAFGNTLYLALKKEWEKQQRKEEENGDDYTIYVLKKETDEKGNDMFHTIPIKKRNKGEQLQIPFICITENGQYTSTDSFKFCSRIIHKELKLAFDYHSLRHTHATLLIESGADIKNVQARLGHSNIQTTLQTYVHNTEKMEQRSVALFEKITGGKDS